MSKLGNLDRSILIAQDQSFSKWPENNLTVSFYEQTGDLDQFYAGRKIRLRPGSTTNIAYDTPGTFSAFKITVTVY